MKLNNHSKRTFLLHIPVGSIGTLSAQNIDTPYFDLMKIKDRN